MFNENSKTRIKEIKTCTNNNENSVRIQDLKNQTVEELTNDNNAKGERSTSNFIKIYLIEYENSKLINPMEKKLFSIPSNENRLKLFGELVK